MQRHSVNVPTDFYARFTRDVVVLAQEAGSGCEGRVISVLEGGYSDRSLCSWVLAHLSGLCAQPADAVMEEAADAATGGGAQQLDDLMSGLRIDGVAKQARLRYDSD
ncbi:histone deacetylase, partial [Teratosphaeriaceae sp. CCFEE 6253]